jgi:hypothetical protein
MKLKQKEIGKGFLAAVFATFSGVFLYLEIVSSVPFEIALKRVREVGLYGPVIALGAVSNLFVFFVFLRKKQDFRAQGVLFATLLTALVSLIIKFI